MVGQNMMGTADGTHVQPADVLGDIAPVILALQHCVAVCRGMEAPERAAGGANHRVSLASSTRPSCCLECAQVCSLTISLLNERSELSIDAADLCSKACERCASAMSERVDDVAAQECAEVCGRTAEAIHKWRPLSTTQATDSVEAFGG
jgi:hypothetical protein